MSISVYFCYKNYYNDESGQQHIIIFVWEFHELVGRGFIDQNKNILIIG